MIKNLIVILEENKELVGTIENTLQALPESVIIQSLDSETNTISLKYANCMAKESFMFESGALKDTNETKFKDLIVKLVNEEEKHEC